ncbi:MAG: CRISPR-associated endonuclease Cas3'' [Thiothrix litoralis]
MPTSSLLNNAAAHLVELAGLFHDFGKANQAFQDKLKSTAKKPKKQGDPLRHEYVSWWMLEQLVIDILPSLKEGDSYCIQLDS